MRTFFAYTVAVVIALTNFSTFSVSQETPYEEELPGTRVIIKKDSIGYMDTIAEQDAREVLIEKKERFYVIAGIGGFPEAIHMGARVKLIPQIHMGAYVGGMYEPAEFTLSDGGRKSKTWIAYGAMTWFYFVGSSDDPKTHLWFLRAGPGFLRDNNYNYTQKMTFADLRLGRAFGYFNKYAFELDAGTAILLNEKTEPKHGRAIDELSDLYTKKINLSLGFRIIIRV